MKFFKLFIILAVISTLGLNCVRIDEAKDAQQMVQQTLSKFYAAQEARDADAIMALYKQDSTAVALGPNSEDQSVGWEQIRDNWQRYLASMQKVRIWRRDEKIHMNFQGNFAWVSSVNQVEITRAGRTEMHRFFFSAAMQKVSGRWMFVQTHISESGETGLAAMQMGRQLKENAKSEKKTDVISNKKKKSENTNLNLKESRPASNSAGVKKSVKEPDGRVEKTETKLDSISAAKPDTSEKK